ncbi:hypothetical protein ZIOFF_035957 [Zingiber officinale]|uniref:UBP-type domain-containing protein n=1 Tax=Zingiber officinale TaxID=94328 RepID=A0A8J5G9J5_ZINOF|nr:hypothetical protein ZIOFF_035957 [Zingiber officinale]
MAAEDNSSTGTVSDPCVFLLNSYLWIHCASAQLILVIGVFLILSSSKSSYYDSMYLEIKTNQDVFCSRFINKHMVNHHQEIGHCLALSFSYVNLSHDLNAYQLTEELTKLDEKLKLTESLLESKNLEIKKINDEKKAALATQFAAEATL